MFNNATFCESTTDTKSKSCQTLGVSVAKRLHSQKGQDPPLDPPIPTLQGRVRPRSHHTISREIVPLITRFLLLPLPLSTSITAIPSSIAAHCGLRHAAFPIQPDPSVSRNADPIPRFVTLASCNWSVVFRLRSRPTSCSAHSIPRAYPSPSTPTKQTDGAAIGDQRFTTSAERHTQTHTDTLGPSIARLLLSQWESIPPSRTTAQDRRPGIESGG